tara:strand:+ start:72 stop:665 length:594 start_codon:yes stop_codon:yes gene_type:complete
MFKPLVCLGMSTHKLQGINNEAICKAVLELKNSKIGPEGDTSHEDSEYPLDNKECKKLLNTVLETAQKEIHSKLQLFDNNIWAHILEPNESTMLHTHKGGPLNGPPPISWVYYTATPPRSGNIVFTFDCNANRVLVEEEIEENKLIFFSGDIPHYTKKNFSDKNRISISGNFNLPLDTHWGTFDEENWLAYVGVFVN